MLGKNLIQAAAGNIGAAGGLGIEDVFSTWLYTGNGSTQTITNGIDLAGEGGMAWCKARLNAYDHVLGGPDLGTGKLLSTNNTQEVQTFNSFSSFNNDGFTLGNLLASNGSGVSVASWTFRKARGFFDVVTYTGDSTQGRAINHNLGSVPGCIIVKGMNASAGGAANWTVYHRSLGTDIIRLNLPDGAVAGSYWGAVTDTTFSPPTLAGGNQSGVDYIAYLFAHDEQIFGEGGDQSVIKCGSYTGNGSPAGAVIDLGWEPQWVLIKRTSSSGSWLMFDNMRGLTVGTGEPYLLAESSGAEAPVQDWINPLPTGFQLSGTQGDSNASSAAYIYIAIRRGPMKTPTSGTEVFTALAATGSTNTSRTVGFSADLSFTRWRSGVTAMQAVDRLRGMPTSSNANALLTSSTAAEAGYSPYAYDIWNTTAKDGSNANLNDMVWQYFRRAPGFFDVVAYTGTGTNLTNAHGLGVAPDLLIVKRRSGSTGPWYVYSSALGVVNFLTLNTTDATFASGTPWNSTAPTSTAFTVGGNANQVSPYIAYLFATLPGISKVFSFTGNGTSQTIDCGFAAGARFVLLKRTDSAGNWLVADAARGIISGNDPLLYLNSTAAEITTLDWVDPHSSGFIVNQEAAANANVGGATYIGLAIA